MADVRIDVEVVVVDPPRPFGIFLGDLAEAAVTQHALRDGALQALEVHSVFEDHHADDLHQVLRTVHAQPGGVDTGDTFT